MQYEDKRFSDLHIITMRVEGEYEMFKLCYGAFQILLLVLKKSKYFNFFYGVDFYFF